MEEFLIHKSTKLKSLKYGKMMKDDITEMLQLTCFFSKKKKNCHYVS